jgi:MFS superfamily sulfate permease-like transporter
MMAQLPRSELLPGCVLFRFDAPLVFANTRTFRDQIRRLARSEPPPKWIVVPAEPITDVDTTAADIWRTSTKPSTPVGSAWSSRR